MKRKSAELLASQLQHVLLAYRTDSGEAFEVAVIAGLLSRYRSSENGTLSPAEALLAEASQLQPAGGWQNTLPDPETASEVVDRICAVSELESEFERADAILDLDELVAGSHFLGEAQRYRPACSEAAAAIRAYPELWRSLAPWASRVLAEAPPKPGDPSRLIWQALESCQLTDNQISAPPCDAARRVLDLPLVLSRSRAAALQPALFAASDLPPQQRVQTIKKNEHFELALGLGPDSQPVLILRCNSRPQLFCQSSEVALRAQGPTLFVAAAAAGEYRLCVGADECLFEITE